MYVVVICMYSVTSHARYTPFLASGASTEVVYERVGSTVRPKLGTDENGEGEYN